MLNPFSKATLCVALLVQFAFGQADQLSRQQKKPAQPVIDFSGRPVVDPESAERGKNLYLPACGFCHGPDARGKSGPDLLRSTLVLHDDKGNSIGKFLRVGRPDRGMPAFSSLTDAQVTDIAAFLHAGTAAVANRMSYEIKGLLTGDAPRGEQFFNGAGGCASCHSPSGDLAHIAARYEPVELQRRFLYPAPNMIDVFMGKAVKPKKPDQVTVTLPSGEQLSGILVHADEFTIALRDSTGWYRSFDRTRLKQVDIQSPLAAHEALLGKYSDQQMHDTLAYLETLK